MQCDEECLLVHRDFVKNQRVQLLDMLSSLQRKGVVIKGCADSQKLSIDLPQIVSPQLTLITRQNIWI